MPPIIQAEVMIPATAALLVTGGDARIALDAGSGCNKYGCQAHPDPDLIALGSSTASVVSESGFAAADKLRDALLACAVAEAPAACYARELERMRAELGALCGIADLPGVEVVFAASGTDSHLIAAQLVRNQGQALQAIMVDAVETGSGVAAALAGRHFSTRTALARMVDEGAAVSEDVIPVEMVAMRMADSSPRAVAAMDADVTARARAAIAAGRRVLLTLVDVSKTGMITPSVACVVALHQQFPEQLDVLVDACQFRIMPSTLRAYLQQGFMVAITGSKFISGPTFSGALLIPEPMAKRLQRYPLPSSLRAYSARADWSCHWDATQLVEDAANYGLLLRWEAALAELRAFRAIPEQAVAGFLQTFAEAVVQKLSSDPVFGVLSVPALERSPVAGSEGWDSVPTIFPFQLYRQSSRAVNQLLSCDEMVGIYQLLQRDLSPDDSLLFDVADQSLLAKRVQLGQPVLCGVRNDVPVSALRVCASARLVVDALSPQGVGTSAVIARTLAALDKVALLVRAHAS